MTTQHKSGFSDYLGDALMLFKYLAITFAAAGVVMYVSGVTI